jgi:hypothetical protein
VNAKNSAWQTAEQSVSRIQDSLSERKCSGGSTPPAAANEGETAMPVGRGLRRVEPTSGSSSRHTRRELTPTKPRPSSAFSIVKAQAAALSLHPWGNTPEEWLRSEVCLVLIEERRRSR